MQLDLFNNNKIKIYESFIKKLICTCYHYKNTKSKYNQKEIADYILMLIDDLNL